MGKVFGFWLIIFLTALLFIGGGAWLFFWIYGKAKKNKMFL